MLDGLRGLAAISVLLYHADYDFAINPMLSRGYLSVDLFFLLSGYVLTLSFEPRLNAGLSVWTFMRARFVRFFPMVALGAMLGALQMAAAGENLKALVLLPLALAMIPIVIPDGSKAIGLFPLNAPQWSLFFELVVNVAHAGFLRKLSHRSILLVAAICGIALAASIMTYGNANFGADTGNWFFAFARISYAYCFGIWLARRTAAGRALPSLPWFVVLALPFFLEAGLGLCDAEGAVGDALAVLVALPLLLWFATCVRCPPAVAPVLARLGTLSFPLYAVHDPFLALCRAAMGTGAGAVPAICLSLCAAWAVDRVMAPGGATAPHEATQPEPQRAVT